MDVTQLFDSRVYKHIHLTQNITQRRISEYKNHLCDDFFFHCNMCI